MFQLKKSIAMKRLMLTLLVLGSFCSFTTGLFNFGIRREKNKPDKQNSDNSSNSFAYGWAYATRTRERRQDDIPEPIIDEAMATADRPGDISFTSLNRPYYQPYDRPLIETPVIESKQLKDLYGRPEMLVLVMPDDELELEVIETQAT